MRHVVIKRIDRSLLQQQRVFLWRLSAGKGISNLSPDDMDNVEGLINLTDRIADQLDGFVDPEIVDSLEEGVK